MLTGITLTLTAQVYRRFSQTTAWITLDCTSDLLSVWDDISTLITSTVVYKKRLSMANCEQICWRKPVYKWRIKMSSLLQETVNDIAYNLQSILLGLSQYKDVLSVYGNSHFNLLMGIPILVVIRRHPNIETHTHTWILLIILVWHAAIYSQK